MSDAYRFAYLPVTNADICREIYVTSVGRLRYKPGAPYPSAGHPAEYDFDWPRGRVLGDFAVVLIERGEGEYEDRQFGRVSCRGGDVLFLPPGAWHRYRPTRSVGWTESWVCANGALLHRWRSKGMFPHTPVVRRLRHCAEFRASHLRLRRMSGGGNSFRLSAQALACFCVALEGGETSHRGDPPTAAGATLVDRAIAYILLNCHRPLNVPAVAGAVGATRRTLERAFADGHARSVADEIAWSRMERARLMLAEGNMSLKEAGYATGLGGGKRLVATFRRFRQPIPTAARQSQA